MIFFFIMPGVMSGLGNLLLPVQLGVPELVFPKVNNLGTQQATSPGRGMHSIYVVRRTAAAVLLC